MMVTIEGVINSDVCGRGERHTVEMTPRLKGLIDNRIVRVIATHDPEPPEEPKRKRRARRRSDAEAPAVEVQEAEPESDEAEPKS